MDRDRWLLLLPEPVRRLPADLVATIGLTIATVLVVALPWVNETPLRVVFGLPFVLFLPGYAFIAALFPEAGESPVADSEGDRSGTGSPAAESGPNYQPGTEAAAAAAESDADDEGGLFAGSRDRGIDGIERVALSFGLSIAIVPLIGLVLNFTPWGIRLAPIVISVSGFTIIAAGVAAVRRWELPEDEQFVVPYREWIAAGRAELFEPDDRVDAILNVALALSVLLAVGSVGYAIAVPPQGEQFSEFYILTEDDDGELVADGYPESFVVGDSEPIVVGIGNQEYETVEYTVVVEAHAVEFVNESTGETFESANETNQSVETRIVDRERVGMESVTVAHNETRHMDMELAPTMTGEDVRLTFMLFRDGEVPEEPTTEDAYRSLHLWVDVR